MSPAARSWLTSPTASRTYVKAWGINRQYQELFDEIQRRVRRARRTRSGGRGDIRCAALLESFGRHRRAGAHERAHDQGRWRRGRGGRQGASGSEERHSVGVEGRGLGDLRVGCRRGGVVVGRDAVGPGNRGDDRVASRLNAAEPGARRGVVRRACGAATHGRRRQGRADRRLGRSAAGLRVPSSAVPDTFDAAAAPHEHLPQLPQPRRSRTRNTRRSRRGTRDSATSWPAWGPRSARAASPRHSFWARSSS